jgi:hypothetical protein
MLPNHVGRVIVLLLLLLLLQLLLELLLLHELVLVRAFLAQFTKQRRFLLLIGRGRCCRYGCGCLHVLLGG